MEYASGLFYKVVLFDVCGWDWCLYCLRNTTMEHKERHFSMRWRIGRGTGSRLCFFEIQQGAMDHRTVDDKSCLQCSMLISFMFKRMSGLTEEKRLRLQCRQEHVNINDRYPRDWSNGKLGKRLLMSKCTDVHVIGFVSCLQRSEDENCHYFVGEN